MKKTQTPWSGIVDENAGKTEYGKIRIIIAGGGTGGHLFPAIAIADKFMELNSQNSIRFIGSGRPFEKRILSEKGYPFENITVEGIKGRSFFSKIQSAQKIPKGLFESMKIIDRFSPDAVFGMGGYASGPVIFAAWLKNIKTAICEQNILPGMTNRVLSRFADRIYVSFQDTILKPMRKDKVRVTGNPIRKEIIESIETAASVHHEKFTVMVFGGSQGAAGINNAVIDALDYLSNESYFFIHQTGEKDRERVVTAYRDRGIDADVDAFFSDIWNHYMRADILICRAGATTVAEMTALGKGVIFIPFPYAADNHQALNAKSLKENGAADMILEKDLSGKILAGKIRFYARNQGILKEMGEKLKRFSRPNAARAIVDDCYKMIHPES